MSQRRVKITVKKWPVAGVFKISRSALTEIQTVIVEISESDLVGRGECRPYARYDETSESVVEEILGLRESLENDLSAVDLQNRLPAGAARNAVDCALWDLRSRLEKRPVWDLLGLPQPRPRRTAFTLSMDTTEAMVDAALNARQYPLLKVKIGDEEGIQACLAILEARPDAELIVDANEAFSPDELPDLTAQLNHPRIALIEQPVPAGQDRSLEFDPDRCRPLCADESVHDTDDLERLWVAGYRAVNVKLDKTGGLTETHKLMQAAKAQGFQVMAGCMVASSLAMAPMLMLESFADFIDLDGPLLLSEDIANGLVYNGPVVFPPRAELWGYQEPEVV